MAFMLACTSNASAQALSSQGYSGPWLIPNAHTLQRGSAHLAYANGLIGAPITSGHNVTAGFGLADNVEFTSTLATNTWNCNFYSESCAGSQIRDLSSSVKWAPTWQPFERWGWRAALGAKDVGGAANNFKSRYAVAEHERDSWSAVVGYAHSPNGTAPLDGVLASLTVKLPGSLEAGLQSAGINRLAWVGWTHRLNSSGTALRLSAFQRLEDAPRMPSNGFEVSVSTALQSARITRAQTDEASVRIRTLDTKTITSDLERAGFPTFELLETGEERDWVLIAENTSFHESPLDAAGAGMALLSAVPEGHEGQGERVITVVITQRGLPVVSVRALASCYRQWLQNVDRCPGFADIRSYPVRVRPADAKTILKGQAAWWRPEIVLSPNLLSTLGTEVGSFDFDLGLNANIVLPMWKGATLDFNRLIPTNLKTDDFRDRVGAFWPQQHVPGFDRKMIHQLVRWESMRTTVRMSAGTLFKKWEGGQVEFQTVSPDGTHRISGIWGKFQHPVFVRQNRREYAQFAYRYAWDIRQTQTTQLQVGEFWGGDRGYQLTQRFWSGERNVAIHFRQTRFAANQPIATFAGLSITLPLTPAVNRSTRHLGVRGTTAYSYGFETRMRNPQNLVGGGYGIFPPTGEGIGQTFNRDRIGDGYFDTQTWRLRESARFVRDELGN